MTTAIILAAVVVVESLAILRLLPPWLRERAARAEAKAAVDDMQSVLDSFVAWRALQPADTCSCPNCAARREAERKQLS